MIHRRILLTALSLFLAVASTPAAFASENFASSRVTVTVTGSGEDVILIPGLSSSPRVWREMIDAVPGYRYHQVQLKGFAGLPRDGNGEGDVAAPVAEEIARYIAEQKLGAVDVIGHSMGGTIAMMIAARHPDAVSKLMVVDMLSFMGVGFGGPNATRETLKPVADAIRAAMINAPAETYAKQLEATIAAYIRTEPMRAVALDDANRSDRDVASRAYAELIVTDLRPELSKITAPSTILYVTPAGSPISDVQIDGIFTAAYANLKGATLRRAPDAAHFIMWDNGPWFQSEVKHFLAG